MSVFQEVTFIFKGNEYKIPSNKIMMLISNIEDIVTLSDLTTGKGPKLSKLAEAYCFCLNYAGGKFQIEDVYESMFGTENAGNVQGSITNLVMLMVPPSNYQPDTEKTGKQPAAE